MRWIRWIACWIAVTGLIEMRAAAQTSIGGWDDMPACSTCGPQGSLEGSTCGLGCSDPRPASVQFTVDFLVLDRNQPDSGPLLLDTQTGGVLLDTGDLLKHGEFGTRLGMILIDQQGTDVEFSYLGLNDFENSISVTSPNPIVFPFYGGVPANPQSSYTTFYRSRLRGGELNLRRHWSDRVTLLAGARILDLQEDFNITSTSGAFASEVDNDLYGLQIGGDLQLMRIRRSILFTTIKSGVYYNNANVSALARLGSNPIQFIDDEDELAYVGDVAAGLLIPMGSHADFRIGYQGLYLTGVGLAPDQSDNYSLFTGSGSLDTSTLMYHGGFVGLDIFW